MFFVSNSTMKDALTLLARTDTGADVMNDVHDRSISFGLDLDRNDSYGTIKTGKIDGKTVHHITFAQGLSVAMLANLALHELEHVRSFRNKERTFGNGSHFRNNPVAFADAGYPRILEEAHSFGLQAINAIELARLGEPGPWRWHCFGVRAAHIRPAERFLARVNMPEPQELYQAIAHDWLTKSPIRSFAVYEPNFLAEACRTAVEKDLKPGLSHSNADLACIANNGSGRSLMEGMNLRDPMYLGIWSKLTTWKKLEHAALSEVTTGEFRDALRRANETLTLLEDEISGRRQWSGLPAGVDHRAAAESVVNGRFSIHVRNAAFRIHDAEILPEEEQAITQLFERTETLAEKTIRLAEPLQQAVTDARRDMKKYAGRQMSTTLFPPLPSKRPTQGTGSKPPLP